MVKWGDYGGAGQSQERDLLTHLMSIFSGAACWLWPHSLPNNPTRDGLTMTQDVRLEDPKCLPHRVSTSALIWHFHSRVNEETELFVHSKYRKRGVRSAECRWRACSGGKICSAIKTGIPSLSSKVGLETTTIYRNNLPCSVVWCFLMCCCQAFTSRRRRKSFRYLVFFLWSPVRLQMPTFNFSRHKSILIARFSA